MESRNLFEELEGWVQIDNPETEASKLEKKIETTQSEKNLLKKEIAQHLQDTINTLKSVDLAKLNYEKLEIDLKNTNDALEKQSLAHAAEKARLHAQITKHQNTISTLKKACKANKQKRKKTKKLLTRLSNTLEKIDHELSYLMKSLAELDQIKIQLKEANVWVTHFEKITIQRNAEIMQLKKINTEQKSLIEKLSHSRAGFFSPRNTSADTNFLMKHTFQPG